MLKAKSIKVLGLNVVVIPFNGDIAIGVSFMKIKSLSTTVTFTPPTMSGISGALKLRISDIMDRTGRQVYYFNSGMDCDGVQYGSPVKFDNIGQAEERMEDDYKWADGPTNWNRITKDQYMASTSYMRDLGMEAHEDGHPHNLHS